MDTTQTSRTRESNVLAFRRIHPIPTGEPLDARRGPEGQGVLPFGRPAISARAIEHRRRMLAFLSTRKQG